MNAESAFTGLYDVVCDQIDDYFAIVFRCVVVRYSSLFVAMMDDGRQQIFRLAKKVVNMDKVAT